jgi:apolipoprotein N-acyltransferase
MKQANFSLKKIKWRRAVSVLLTAIALLVINAFSPGDRLQANADDSTQVPDYSYQLKLTAENIKRHTENDGEYLGNNAQQNLNKAVDKARDNVNVDKLSQNTKKIVDSVQEKTNEVLNGTMKSEKNE